MGGGGERRRALNKTSIQTVGTRHDWESVWGEREEPLLKVANTYNGVKEQ